MHPCIKAISKNCLKSTKNQNHICTNCGRKIRKEREQIYDDSSSDEEYNFPEPPKQKPRIEALENRMNDLKEPDGEYVPEKSAIDQVLESDVVKKFINDAVEKRMGEIYRKLSREYDQCVRTLRIELSTKLAMIEKDCGHKEKEEAKPKVVEKNKPNVVEDSDDDDNIFGDVF
eukprot:TRINITY_DN1484_c0_g3_i1.p1 TRINITY_DN1484_c0_g3~~TRINITY_DN1484_c0_g3_i1.p1  ORF type:complete len:184 (+),score=38.79 TRINITY_DN1484_c0_g3_i1:36-554(+)